MQQTAYGDITPDGGYCGDEDQGQLSALSALMAMGIFDAEGGASVKPTCQITALAFGRVTIHLDRDYFPGKEFVINARNNSPTNILYSISEAQRKSVKSILVSSHNFG